MVSIEDGDADTRLRLTRGHWYAWQLLPGYSGEPGSMEPYISPIRIDAITPLQTGSRRLALQFYNAGYAEGARDFDVVLSTLKRQSEYLIATIAGSEDRTCIIHPLSKRWLQAAIPDLISSYPPLLENGGTQSALQHYLERLYSDGHI